MHLTLQMPWNTLINAENNRSFSTRKTSQFAVMLLVPRLPRAFRTCVIWFTFVTCDFWTNRKVWNERPLNSSNSCGLHKRQNIFVRLSFYHQCYFRNKVINCEVCVHIKHVSKSVNSAGLLHEGMFSNNFAQLSLNFRDKVSICSCRYIPGSWKFTQLPLLQAQSSVWNRLSFLNNFLMFLHKLNKIFRAN